MNICMKDKVEAYLGRTFCPCTEVHIRHFEGGSDRIVFWSGELPKAQPTDKDLEAVVVEEAVAPVAVEVKPSDLAALQNRVALLEALLLERPANG
jgi:hypothetical protein